MAYARLREHVKGGAMTLIICRECEKQVSSTAAACPHCGAPVAQAGRTVETPLATMQLTSKKLKLHRLLSSLVLWTGIIWLLVALVASMQERPVSRTSWAWASGLFIVGAVWSLRTKMRIWWHHK